MGFTRKILNNATSALSAHQALIGVTGNNVANVNTEGYSRRRVDLDFSISRSNQSALTIGNGTSISTVQRIADDYVQKELVRVTGESAAAQLEDDFIRRVEGLFDITGDTPSIGGSLTDFFTAVNDLRLDPSSIELRANLLSKADTLTNSISTTMNSLASLQDEADRRLENEIATVNQITSEIAELNSQIQLRERGETVAADERDKRELLLQKLSEKIEYQRTDNADGTVLLTLDGGFPLVYGSEVRELSLTTSPSFAAGPLPNSLSGGVLNYVTYDFDPGAAQSDLDFTQSLQQGGGSVGALLRVRGFNAATNTSPFEANGRIVEVAQRIEGIARSLLTDFNTTYLGADEDAATAGFQPNALDLDGNPPADQYGFFTFDFAGTRDTNADNLPNDLGTHGIDSYARTLQVAISDPREVAAARDTDPLDATTSLQESNKENLDALYALRDTDRSYSVGGFSYTGTYEEAYGETLSYVGNAASGTRIKRTVAEGSLEALQNRRDEISGVSLDEEFSKLILFQKGYEASARMIRVAEELLNEVIQLL